MFKIPDRYAADDLLQVANAVCAASKANSTSSLLDLAALVKTLPSMGLMFSKYSPFTGGTNFPPIKLSYFVLNSGFFNAFFIFEFFLILSKLYIFFHNK